MEKEKGAFCNKVHRSTINAIYNETIDRINLAHLSKICEALDCRVEDLLQYIPDEEYYEHRRKPMKKKAK